MRPHRARKPAAERQAGQQGFTLIEMMVGIVLMTVGLLSVAEVLPRGLALSLYGKDQTRATSLAQQKIEYFKDQGPTFTSATSTCTQLSWVGDYATGTSSPTQTEYFDQNGNLTTQSQAYFTRDVQIEYWTWSASVSQFTQPSNPFTMPACRTQYVYRVATATHWLERGQTAFSSGNATAPNGCIVGGAAMPTGIGCVQVSTFITP